MFRQYVILLFYFLFFSPFLFSQGFWDDEDDCLGCSTLSFNGIDRQYKVHKPENLKEKPGILFVLHGYGGDANWSENLGFNQLSDSLGFIVCYPQGLKDQSGLNHWNARLTISQVNDLAFLSELAKKLQEKYQIDKEKTFVSGFSNGGYMSYTLGCEASHIFKGIASVGGMMSEYTWNNCKPSESIPVLEIHGQKDYIVPINGKVNAKGGWAGSGGSEAIIKKWVQINHCTIQDEIQYSEKAIGYRYSNSKNKNTVEYIKIDNYGHRWPKDDKSRINACEIICTFFGLDQ